MNSIIIRGASQHNLKDIDLTLPREKLIVVTGVSGSGKSSLAFDTIYAEGQRKYVESLSAYARQFLQQLQKPEVEHIEGLSPAIAIQQRHLGANPRSTVATITEIHDYLRVIYARLGTVHCAKCGIPVTRTTVQEMVDGILGWKEGNRILVLARVVDKEKGVHDEMLRRLRQDGLVRARIDGEVMELESVQGLNRRAAHTIDAVIDRLVVKPSLRNRLTDSMELALQMGEGRAFVARLDGEGDTVFTEKMVCPACKAEYEEPGPAAFSFNSPHGACPGCHGLGRRLEFDVDLIVDSSRAIDEGGLKPFQYGGKASVSYYRQLLRSVARQYGFDLNVPFASLKKRWKRILLHGSGDEDVIFRYWRGRRSVVKRAPFEGVIPMLQRRFRQTESSYVRNKMREFMKERECTDCAGRRLKPESLAVTWRGCPISEFLSMSIGRALAFVRDTAPGGRELEIGAALIREVEQRLRFMEYVGLGYLTLDRESGTLSGGEAQRTRLATQVGAGLTGVLYVLDEPSIGLHTRDTRRLLDTLTGLRDIGNTVIVVEHDEETIRAADHIVDLGPGPGIHGGEVVAQGGIDEIINAPDSLTGRYLSGKERIRVPGERRKPGKQREVTICGVNRNNLKNIDVRIPLGLFCCVTGVSGAGKSSLVDDTLHDALGRDIPHRPAGFMKVRGRMLLDRVVIVDQSPIGRTPRSNQATYTGLYGHIRGLFARHPEAKMRGYKPGRFSFNVKGGRCEACRGDGVLRVEMHFLPDVYVQCEACGGRRFNRETLEIRFKGKNIADVLSMTIEEALEFFRNVPPLRRKLQLLNDVGMGYLTLGQPAPTLSGGEAQRLKLARELGRAARGHTLYIFDEPTTGLHFADIRKLIEVLQRLVEADNTVMVVEHNLEVIKCADWIIDLGPEGGDEGGYIVAEGPPEEIAGCKGSYTGKYLKNLLAK